MVGAVSEADRKKILAEAPAVKVGLVPNAPGEDLARLYYERKPDFEKPVVFYQSNFHWMQNVEGAKILAEKVFPLIKGKVPKAVCYIAGQNARAKVGYLRCDDVTIADLSTEDVAGVVAAYRRGVVFVAPLRGPGGTRLKILGAMTAGVPVVTTSIGAAGLEVTNGQDIIIADSPEAIAAAAGKLLQEREFYRRIAKNARQLVEKKYNWKAISESLNYLYEEIAKS
jgi:glycosyltransferase involved in cell wall biosynthesis